MEAAATQCSYFTSVEGEMNRYRQQTTSTWKWQMLWSMAKAITFLRFFLDTFGTVVISHMVLEMVGLCNF